ncbi:MAG: hypothetical protein ACK47N_23935 [Microcystis sp.]|jgi:hypothetical protein|uniref:Uncharacterized protein n=1 Tax=Microcystis aeruginosa PCC 9807 TaxID=1160283 RepID=I4H421_MICAE|nr:MULTISPECIES: hypothetical protein [Microcystis]NCQ91403.1 hypothetical protein [Microcystis aeruginosa LG13-13]NCR04601.1 hypothetical protein [Microcystis aeruginosa LG13-03]NCR44143.1 hypothetical protein [Microcystis aeruginosa SX13-01]NCR62864.1 hypothetical protein [Microcystis aeruginosa LG11-05]NCR71745.1 hypothetical protein [Microcystis aeruginosa LG13-12]REJ53750.1 MAG: hypothetical protein DWQ58_10275 [Microcystis aeruginosa TA09]
MTEDRLERIEKIVESNSRAIQALADAVARDREERKQEQKGLYDYLARIASAQSDFYQTQADFYRHLERMDDRHAQMIEIIRQINENKSDRT